jgi:hypothetical protein
VTKNWNDSVRSVRRRLRVGTWLIVVVALDPIKARSVKTQRVQLLLATSVRKLSETVILILMWSEMSLLASLEHDLPLLLCLPQLWWLEQFILAVMAAF